LLGKKEVPGELRKMIAIEKSCLQNAFISLKKCISYVGVKDIGLPDALMPYLERPLLQVLLHWCLEASEEEIKESRAEIIRFILFWMVGGGSSRNTAKASVAAIALLSDGNKHTEFPAHLLYEKLTSSDDETDPLFKPLINYCGDKTSNEKVLRTAMQRAKMFFGDEGEGLYHQFTGRRHLLLWFQREWVQESYHSTDFMSGQDEDTVPYDFDHLVPQSNWSSFQGRGTHNEAVIENHQRWSEHWVRRDLGNSIGNYRVMDASDNRSRGDTPLTVKVGDATESFLNSSALWGDYAFSLSDAENDWQTASPKDPDCWYWDDARVLAFQHAVESRALNLYQCLFDEASMATLINKSAPHKHV